MSEATTHTVAFGLPAAWVAVGVLLGVYALVMMERFNRAVLALLGAGLMILLGVITQEEAIHGIDFNTIGLLVGMMVIVSITQKTGVFEYVAIVAAKAVRGHPVGVMFMLSTVTAVFSAFLDNVTTVLLIVPVTLLIADALQVRPYPYLFAEILASNIGGTATLIGDPPNIMIGSQAHLSFYDFLVNLAPIVIPIFLFTAALIWLMFRRDFVAEEERRRLVMEFNEREAIRDPVLLKKSLTVLAGVIAGFTVAHAVHLEPATIALFGAAVLLLWRDFAKDLEAQDHAFHETFGEVEWTTIFFFVGLFVVVAGVEHVGVIDWLAEKTLALTGGDFAKTAAAILWVSAIASAVIDNIPFVATMIPLIHDMAPAFGGEEAIRPLWWALALGACLGGNGSLIGASANIIVAGFAQRAGHPITFLTFTKHAFGLMLLSIAIAHAYLVWRYLG